MTRYILYCRGGPPDPSDLEKVENEPGVTIVDREVARAMLVEATEEAAASLKSSLKNWTVAAEVIYPSPRLPRQEIKNFDKK